MDFQVADWALKMDFLRIRPGAEESLVDLLLKNPQQQSHLFKCFGNFDLLLLTESSSMRIDGILPEGEGVLQSVCTYALAWEWDSTHRLSTWLGDAVVLAVVLVKLNPALLGRHGLQFELNTMEALAEGIGRERVNSFSSMGHSEITLLIKGDDPAEVYRLVDQARRSPALRKVLSPDEAPHGQAALAKTTTIMAVSYDNVITPRRFELVKGELEAQLKMSCAPGAEDECVKRMPDGWKKTASANVGRFDVSVQVNGNAGDYVRRLLDYRRSIRGLPVYSTYTDLTVPFQDLGGDVQPEAYEESTVLRNTLGRFDEACKVADLQGNLQGLASTLRQRLGECARDPLLAWEFADLCPFVELLSDKLEKLKQERQLTDRQLQHESLSILFAVALQMLSVRYPTLEAFLEGTGSPSFHRPIGVKRATDAASSLPMYVYEKLFRTINPTGWRGFAWFGAAFQHYEGGEVCFDQEYVFKPIDQWPTATHEMSHGAFYWLRDGLSQLDELASSQLPQIQSGTGPEHISRKQLIWELFAHWFDFTYFHQGTAVLDYICGLWSTWMDVPQVWNRKQLYLFRSLLTVVWADLEALHDTRAKPLDRVKLIEQKWYQMIEALQSVPQFEEYMSDVAAVTSNQIRKDAFKWDGLVVDFRREFSFAGMTDDSPQTLQALEEEAKAVAGGKAIPSLLTNPVALLLKLFYASRKDGTAADHRSSAALILTLANDYRLRLSERLRSGTQA